jgi:PAS domain S-box-containing protein
VAELQLSELERCLFLALTNCETGFAVLALDKKGKILFVNRACELQFGYYHDRITREMSLEDLVRLPMLPGGSVEKAFPNIQRKGLWEGEGVGINAAGDSINCSVSLVYTFLSEDGEKSGLLGIIRDITEIRSKEALLRESVELSTELTNQLYVKNQALQLSRRHLEHAKKALEQELKDVANLQQSLLPAELPQIAELDFGVIYQPSGQASGDYYDVFAIDPNHYGVLVADVSGHGARAAVHMAILRVMFHASVRDVLSPGAALSLMNALTQDFVPEGAFITMFYGIFDMKNKAVKYSSAGHLPPVIWNHRKKEAPKELALEINFPLNLFDDVEYRDRILSLEPGLKIFLYTDGLTEAFNSRREMYGTDRLLRLLEQFVEKDAAAVATGVLEDVHHFRQGRTLEDDFTAVVVGMK